MVFECFKRIDALKVVENWSEKCFSSFTMIGTLQNPMLDTILNLHIELDSFKMVSALSLTLDFLAHKPFSETLTQQA